MQWLKFRTKHSWGISGWEYKPLYIKNEANKFFVEKIIDAKIKEFKHSDRFRGIEYYIVDFIPLKKLKQEIHYIQEIMAIEEKQLEMLTENKKAAIIMETLKKIKEGDL